MTTERNIPEDEIRYRIVVHNPPPRKTYNDAASRLHYWYGNRNYSTLTGVKQVLSRVRRLDNADKLEYHVEKGTITWNWEPCDI